MRTGVTWQQARFSYVAGEPLLESARQSPYDLVPVRGGGAAGGGAEKDVGFFEIFKPEKDDFKGLQKGLAFLKFTPSEQETLFNVIGGAVNFASGVVSVVGAVGAAIDLLQTIGVLSPKEDATQAALKQIGQRVEQIYGYLAAQQRRGLYDEALGWRVSADLARLEVKNAATSRTPETIRTLIDRAAELDRAILTMLDAGKARIAFLRAVYGYHSSGHWIDGAQFPFMATAGGTPVNYRDPAQELQGEIWDAGYYLDVLLRALTDRIAVAATIEPAFRSTGYDRDKFALMADRLLGFVHAWRAAILVADPVYALNPGGTLRSPFQEAPLGIPIGAADPVTGISSFQSHWDGFVILGTRTDVPWAAWGGVYDETRAKDPQAALAAALPLHRALVDQVVKACGLERLMALQRQLRELGSPPVGSDFVALPDATFHRRLMRIELWGREGRTSVDQGEPVTVDLGRLKTFARDPAKTYEGRRHVLHGEKRFTFRMARRADHSRVRLGYRLELGGKDVALTSYASGPGGGGDFPTDAIAQDLEFATKVYDVHQSAHLSNAEENRFERDGYVQTADRLFLNRRDGRVKLRLGVSFAPFAGGAAQGYAGEATVSVEPLEPQTFRDGAILQATVFETHVGRDGAPEEVIADRMTLHLVPSYVLLGPDYFADYHDAERRMLRTIKGINDKYSLSDMEIGPPDPDPAWRVRNRYDTIERQVLHLERLASERAPGLAEVLADHLAPFARPG